jgi:hypothetical protein
MAFDVTKPADNQTIAAGPGDIRENLRALRDDQIVNAGKLNGLAQGNASGSIPVNNGTVNTNLNADLLDGKHESYFSASTHVHVPATSSTGGFMSNTDKIKLDGIPSGAEVNQNAFSNVKIGSTTIQADEKTDTLELAAGAGIALTPDAAGDKVTIAIIQDGHSHAETTTSAAGFMSASDKSKLNGISAGAEVNQNAFANVVAGGATLQADSKSDTLTINAGAGITVTGDANNDALTIAVTANGHAHAEATSNSAGFMSNIDKSKLDGVAPNAEVNQNAFSNVKIGSTTIQAVEKTDTLELAEGTGITLTPDATGDKVTIAITQDGHSHAVVTTSAAGFMSASDKSKLNGIPAGAEVNQNAFANVIAGGATIQADSKTDTLTINAGAGITVTGDAANDAITIMVTQNGHSHAEATTSAAGFMTAGDKVKLNGISDGAQPNQNAFSNISLNGTVIIQADNPTDTLDLKSGDNISLIPDATNDRVTIAVTGKVPSAVVADSAPANGGIANTISGSINGNQVSAPRTDQTKDVGTAREFRWRNYGNGHTIIDNSGGEYPGGNTNSQNGWAPTYPVLMGYNGVNTFGVRVDTARYADSAGSAPANGGNAATVGGAAPGTGANNVLKLDGGGKVPSGNLPVASAAALGGVKIGSGISVDGNGLISAWPSWLAFLGTGAEGVWSSSPNAVLDGEHHYSNFTLTSGHTLTVGSSGILIIRCTGRATIAGTINGAGKNPNATGTGGGSGGGGGWGSAGSISELFPSYKVSGGAAGGAGASPSSQTINILTFSNLSNFPMGASGGQGGGSWRGKGGSGGGFVLIIANEISFTGMVDVSGIKGEDQDSDEYHTGCGGGGGGGGVAILSTKAWVSQTGTINVSGGTGGVHWGSYSGANGGPGGAGWYKKLTI